MALSSSISDCRFNITILTSILIDCCVLGGGLGCNRSCRSSSAILLDSKSWGKLIFRHQTNKQHMSRGYGYNCRDGNLIAFINILGSSECIIPNFTQDRKEQSLKHLNSWSSYTRKIYLSSNIISRTPKTNII